MPIPFFSRESPTLASANWSVIVSQEALIMEWYIVATKLSFLVGVAVSVALWTSWPEYPN